MDERSALLDRLATLIATSPHNLVSRGERERIASVHLPECLAVARALPLAAGQRWMDLGTGGGLPGLVCAIVHPQVHWVLVDATAKKARAVAAFAEELGLERVHVVAARAEVLARDPDHREGYDGVVARAVAGLPALAELARGFLRHDRPLIAIKGSGWREEVEAAGGALRQLRYARPEVTELLAAPEGTDSSDVPGSAARPVVLVSIRAVGSAPPRYPRPDGVPQSRPLGGPRR